MSIWEFTTNSKKNRVRNKLDFLLSSNLIFTACVACKNQFRNQINFLFFKLDISKLKKKSNDTWYFKNQVEIDRGNNVLISSRFFWGIIWTAQLILLTPHKFSTLKKSLTFYGSKTFWTKRRAGHKFYTTSMLAQFDHIWGVFWLSHLNDITYAPGSMSSGIWTKSLNPQPSKN